MGKYVDEIVIDANMDLQWPHRMSLMPPSSTYSALIALISYRVGLCFEAPCTQLTRSLYPADVAKDPGDGPEALMDVGEALDGWKKH